MLLAWLISFGTLVRVGVEGTGAYGAALSSFLHREGVAVVEVDRPDRKTRRLRVSPTRLMPTPRRGRRCRAEPQGTPKTRSCRGWLRIVFGRRTSALAVRGARTFDHGVLLQGSRGDREPELLTPFRLGDPQDCPSGVSETNVLMARTRRRTTSTGHRW